MPLRVLFGPVTSAFAESHLPPRSDAREWLAFDLQGPADLVVGPGDSWEEIKARFPDGWQPDLVVLHPTYRVVPLGLWNAPAPLVAFAGDWNLQGHAYRRLLGHCDRVLTDVPGVEALARAGIRHAEPHYLYGTDRSWDEGTPPEAPRDFDVVFVGNFHPAIQAERLPWLARLAEIAPDARVVVATGVQGEEHRRLLGRARIVFNRSVRGECNARVAEALASGALLFQERDNREVPALLRDREECVLYDDATLESLLRHYLGHEEERLAIARAGHDRRGTFTFAAAWARLLEALERDLPQLQRSCAARALIAPDLTTRVWVQRAASFGDDTQLGPDLDAATRRSPGSAETHYAFAVWLLLHDRGRDPRGAATAAANACQAAWSRDPRHLLAGLGLAEALRLLGQFDHADEQAQRTLAILDALEEDDDPCDASLDAPLLIPGFDAYATSWERIGWQHAGDRAAEVRAKRELLRLRLLALRAELRNDPLLAHAAAALAHDLPGMQAALGCCLARHGRFAEAAGPLRRAVRSNPFDLEAARAYFEVLARLEQKPRQQRFARERRRLHQAAPKLVPREAWFADAVGDAAVPGKDRYGIAWHGDFRAIHSLALVNRELCQRLRARGHRLALAPARHPVPDQSVPLPESLQHDSLDGHANFTVAHQWPPDFTPPPHGHWILVQPWEFGALPRDWIAPINALVDEVWVPTAFVRDCFVAAGIDASRVQVVPHGASERFFEDDVEPLPLPTTKRFKFLFVGGTLPRKGIDVLLKAFAQTFTGQDDVCLIVKDMGVASIYQGQTAEARIAEVRTPPDAPEIVHLRDDLDEAGMAALYRACDCLVHPYRGEGFGLPIVEAMASGLPVIVTGSGAALDFCCDDHAYLVPARRVTLPEPRIGDIATHGLPWLAEPDGDHLRRWLRHVFEHPEEARAKGRRGRVYVREHLTWDHAVRRVELRLGMLRSQPIRRLASKAATAPLTLPQPLNLAGTIGAAPQRGTPLVSLTMIVRNEEHNLADCLASVRDLVDEIVVVDTGSTDRTKEIARNFGARVFDFPWIDHFAAARNEALRHATGRWIFWMDADDRVDDENRARLRTLLASLPDALVGFVMKCHCLGDPASGVTTVVDHVRLFRNHPGLRWTYRIHEQILPHLRALGGSTRRSDVAIRHVGYVNAAVRAGKLQRDLRLLLREFAEQPDDPFTLFNLASIRLEQRLHDEALLLLRRSLANSCPGDSIVQKLHVMLLRTLRVLRRHDEAVAALEAAEAAHPGDPEIQFQAAELHRDRGDRPAAIRCLRRVLETPDGAADGFRSVIAGLRGHLAHHNLAINLQDEGLLDEAAKHWRLALDEAPSFAPALAGLAELELMAGRWPAFDALVQRLHYANQPVEVLVLQARRHGVLKQWRDGLHLIEQAVVLAPDAVWPRVVKAHLLLHEGRDGAAAEQALLDILKLDPTNAEALRNLEVHRRQRGR
jgi:glycosyltransferase involved in cell wall biosynthesis